MTGPGTHMDRSWPDAALFDLDGTLMDREPLMAEAVSRVLRAGGDLVGSDVVATGVGRSWTDIHDELTRASSLVWSFDDFMERVFEEADELIGAGFQVRVLSGAREIIERLAENGVTVAIVTGSLRREVPPVLEQVGVTDKVSRVFAAEDYVSGKPDPESYLLAARTLGVEAGRCVVFEDSFPGVAAGIDAGMWVVASEDANPPVGHPAHQDLSRAHLVVANLARVTDSDILVPMA